MNYVRHLNGVVECMRKDTRLNPTHMSLYFALFHCWNIYRFPDLFFINRQEIMHLSKIGSRVTYLRCLHELSNWSYIHYMPSRNPLKGSRIKMYIFETSSEQVVEEQETTDEPLVGSFKNKNKQKKMNSKRGVPKNFESVSNFFEQQKRNPKEALEFFRFYSSRGWTGGEGEDIRDWKKLAKAWKSKPWINTDHKDHLQTPKNKNYGEPL